MLKKSLFLVALLLTSSTFAIAAKGDKQPKQAVAAEKIDPFKLVALHGESDTHVVRWPDGVVGVFDATGYPYLEQVLDVINRDSGDVRFVKILEPTRAQIQIRSGDVGGDCGNTTLFTHRINRILTSAEVMINRATKCVGDTQSFALYLHEISHAAGFSRHSHHGDGLMDKKIDFNAAVRIPQEYRVFFQTLYSLVAGIEIPARSDELLIDKVDNVSLYSILPESIKGSHELLAKNKAQYDAKAGVDILPEVLTPVEPVKTVDAVKEAGLQPMPEQKPLKEKKAEQTAKVVKPGPKKASDMPYLGPVGKVEMTFGRDEISGRPMRSVQGLVILDAEKGDSFQPTAPTVKQGAGMASSVKGKPPGLFIEGQ